MKIRTHLALTFFSNISIFFSIDRLLSIKLVKRLTLATKKSVAAIMFVNISYYASTETWKKSVGNNKNILLLFLFSHPLFLWKVLDKKQTKVFDKYFK
jgi:hypothetical protein